MHLYRYRFIANVRCLARLEAEVELPTLSVCLCIFVHIFIRPASGQSKQHMVAAWPGSEAQSRSPGAAASPSGSPASPSFGKTLARTGAGASSPSSPASASPGSSGAPSPRAAALPSRTSDMAQRTDFVKSHFADFLNVYSIAMGAATPPLSHRFPLAQLQHFSLLFGVGSSFNVQYSDTGHALCSAAGGSGALTAQQLSTLITQDLTVNDLLANSSSAARQGIASPPVYSAGEAARGAGAPLAGEAPTVLPTVVSSQGRSTLAIWGDHVLSSSGTVRSVRGSTAGSLASTTTVADEAGSRATQPDLDVRMEGCVESKLYALRPVRFANVRGSSRCTVVLGAVQRVATFEALQSCTVIVAAARVRVINCVDCSFHIWCTSPPSIVGDCREITLAPFNVHYPSMDAHLQAAGLMPQESSALAAAPAAGAAVTPLPTSARWKAPRVVAMATEGGAPKPYLIMPPRDWSMTVVPSVCASSDSEQPFTPLLPVAEEYEQANEVAHFSGLAALRSAIADSGLSEDGMAEVQTAVQAHFREWLVSCPEGRDVADMVRIHRYARVHAQAIASAASSEGKHDASAHK